MENLNLFATQMRTPWYKNMAEQARNGVGYHKETWTTRAMIAFENADMEGQIYTTQEMATKLAPFIGWSGNRYAVHNMARSAMRYGIMLKTGKKRHVKGTRNPYPEYEIIGHIEIDPDSGALVSVGMHEHRGVQI